jgi:hypothetical protein
MSTDLEADLRREFDAVGAPGGLTFSPESILRQGNRTIRRHRLIAAGSAAMAVALVATGATLLTRPHDSAVPLPASSAAATGIVRAQVGTAYGVYEITFNRDTSVKPNVHYFFTPPGGQKKEVGSSSTGKPGQKPDAVWRSGIVDGHPVTIGLVPGTVPHLAITLVGISYGYGTSEVEGTGYAMFGVDYTPPPDYADNTARRPSEIASIRWNGPNRVVDGIDGNHRLTGRVLDISKTLSVEVALRPGDGGRTTVLGRTFSGGTEGDLNSATTDPFGVAVVTGRQPMLRGTTKEVMITSDGPPIAVGLLPAGASGIRVILTTGEAASPVVVSERLPDGSVIFAVKVESAHPTDPSTDSIKAVTWTFADGSQGRMDVTQKQS